MRIAVDSNSNTPDVTKQELVQTMTNKTKKPIMILRVKLDPDNYPRLYGLAKENPEMLELRLEIIAKSWGVRSIKSVMQTIENSEPVKVLGEKLDPLYYPKLYQWAKENPETLKTQLKSIANAWHEGNIRSAIQAFESDLEHG